MMKRIGMPLMKGPIIFIVALIVGVFSNLSAQTPGELDFSFEPGSSVNDAVQVVVPTGDGKLYIGGSFTSVAGALRNRIARLNGDGTVDENFDPGSGPNGHVWSCAVRQDGKVLICGDFTSYDGVARNRVARLNADGSLDTGFNSASGANDMVISLALQTDGKVLIGGAFTSYGGVEINGIARINTDGTLDQAFDPGSGTNGFMVLAIALQPDGKMLIGGDFTSFDGVARNRVARLNADGTLDETFDSVSGASGGGVWALKLQADGRVLIGGAFTSYGGVACNRVARINANGTRDESFVPLSGASGGFATVRSLAVRTDGRVLVGGDFTHYDGVPRKSVAQLKIDGTLDKTFDPGYGANGPLLFTVRSLAQQADGQVLVGGAFTSYNGVASNRVARLNADGTLDASFDSGHSGANNLVYSLAEQANGRLLITGNFSSYDGVDRNRIARIYPDSRLDVSFNPGSGANDDIYSLALQADGKILIGGNFSSYNGAVRNCIARLNADGGLDTSFNPGSGANNWVTSINIQADGRILVVGAFTSYDGVVRNRVARLNGDGSLDTSFDPGGDTNGAVRSLALQADGKVLVGGDFTSFNGVVRNRVARLHADGSLDISFDPGDGASSAVISLALQADGKVLVGGDFTSFNGVARNRVARLNANGSLDSSYNVSSGASATVRCFALQADGRVLVGGDFTSFNGVARNRVARLYADGSLDISFDPGDGASGTVNSLMLQADGKVIVAGSFASYDSKPRSRLARLANDTAVQSLAPTDLDSVRWLRSGTSPELTQASFYYSPDGAAWVHLGSPIRISGGWELGGLSLPATGQLRARGRVTGAYYNGCSWIVEQTVPYTLIRQATVTLNSLAQTYDGAPRSVTATTDPLGLNVEITYDGSPDPPVNAGSYTVLATIDNPIYQGGAGGTLVIMPAGQNIDFANPGDRSVAEVFALTAMGGGSGNPVDFAVISGPANIDNGNELHFTGSGTVKVRVTQSGGGNHEAADPVEVEFGVILPRPDLGVGAAPGTLVGRGVYAPQRQLSVLISRKAKPLTGHASVSNAAKLPDGRASDEIKVRGSRRNVFFRVTYFTPTGNVTASIVLGTFLTPALDGDDAAIPLRSSVAPNKRKLAMKKTFNLQLRATSAAWPMAADAATIKVQTR